MLARDLAEPLPSVRRETTGADAARLLAEHRLCAVVVDDDAGRPIAVIPGSHLLALVLPAYLRDDPALAHVIDEAGADRSCAALNEATVGHLLAAERLHTAEPPSVLPDDTLVEIASVMAGGHHPLVLVRSPDGAYHGAITLSRALAAVASAAGQAPRP